MCFNKKYPTSSTHRITRETSRHELFFTREAAGLQFRSKYPYQFSGLLERQNIITSFLENEDIVYRGDVQASPGYSPLGVAQEATIIARMEDDPGTSVSDSSGAASEDNERASLAPRLTLTDWVRSPKRLITYSRRHRGRLVEGNGRFSGEDQVGGENASAPLAGSGRSSRRESQAMVVQGEASVNFRLLSMAYLPCFRGPAPMVDARQVVMGVLSTGPVQSADWWTGVCHRASTRLIGVSDIGGFLDDGNLQFGIEYRQVAKKGLMPVKVGRMRDIEKVMGRIRDDPDLQAISTYQNQFSGSAFSTTEIHLPKPTDPEKRWEVRFDTLEVITVLGRYDYKRRGHMILWDDDSIFPLAPGTTIVIPTGTKRVSFLPVAADEKQFLFRQYFHSSILRWVEKGGYSDSSADREAATSEEVAAGLAAWEAERSRRAQTSQKLFSKLSDVYTL
ncbi:hypothetical protein MVEN_02264500 [Mycena venus]|uniref:Uncharacterized protein n=1 Tax=Mycena venus TaxID=2733690 RepID=A0A8H6X6S0_9AGAR|nr:hypothetical protein MVEN_02264500 [Mycena venus]